MGVGLPQVRAEGCRELIVRWWGRRRLNQLRAKKKLWQLKLHLYERAKRQQGERDRERQRETERQRHRQRETYR